MRIATYNIQNLFHRHIDLMERNHKEKAVLWKDEFEQLMFNNDHSEKNYTRMRELADLLGFHNLPYGFHLSMKNLQGNLFVRPVLQKKDVRASPITDWNGWAQLRSTPIGKGAIINKTKVIMDTDPDILLLQEVEDRSALFEFRSTFLEGSPEKDYGEIFHLEGNDFKGLGMGILLKKGYHIKSLRSFANERDIDGGNLFETNFIQLKIRIPYGRTIYVLNCHLIPEAKNNERNNAKRKRQAKRVAEIYGSLRSKGNENVLVVGTLNAPSYSDSLSPLLQGTDVKDIVKHTSFEVEHDNGDDATYYRMGAYRKGVNIKQKDYMLASPGLFDQINKSGLNRKAVWPLTIPKWHTYASMRNERDAASEHPLQWAEFTFGQLKLTLRKSV